MAEKKVGLLTFHYAKNYGAILQTFALYSMIKELGYNCEIINFITEDVKQYSLSGKSLRELCTYPQLNIKRIIRFKSFLNQMKLSGKEIYTLEEMDEVLEKYSICLVGSDQVWNTDFNFVNYEYFLPTILNKAAYGVSIGDAKVEKLIRYRKYIECFQSISTREGETKRCLEQLSIKKNICNVVDPTLLYSEAFWVKLTIELKIKQPYILCYWIGNSSLPQIIKKYAKQKSMPLYLISYHMKEKKNNCSSAGPIEFISLIKNAEIIFTNTYHGLLFSLIFKKPFYLVTENYFLDSRKKHLIANFGLSDRVINDEFKSTSLLNSSIDYDLVTKKIRAEREVSLAYLKNALNIQNKME